jgi:hypothetical protein
MWSIQYLYRYRRQNTAGEFLRRHIQDRLTRGKSGVLCLPVPVDERIEDFCAIREG